MFLFLSFFLGLLFGAGLCVSGMVNPFKVIGFLDIAGRWDASLALVMAGAAGVMFAAYRLKLKMRKPLCGDEFNMPSATQIDSPLVLGSAIFGIGWGLGGFCPGPAVVSLAFGLPKVYIFFSMMVVGMIIYEFIFLKRKKKVQ